MRKVWNTTFLIVLLSAIWGANHGTQIQGDISAQTAVFSQSTTGGTGVVSILGNGPNDRNPWPIGRLEKGEFPTYPTACGSAFRQTTNTNQTAKPAAQKQTRPSSLLDSMHVRNSRVQLGAFVITAYTNSPSDTGKSPGTPGYGITASGQPTTAGSTIAADWSVLPEGTVVQIQGLKGNYTVQDTGNDVRGKHIDMFVSSEATAVDWGVKKRKVIVIRWGGTRR